MDNVSKEKTKDINLKKYKKIAKENNYDEFYKILKGDCKNIRIFLDERNLSEDKDYFNFLIDFWSNLKISEDHLAIDYYIEKYLENKISFKFESYREYYDENSEKYFLKESNDPKVIELRNNIYIHQKVIERLIYQDIKVQYNLEDEDVEQEVFLNKIGKSGASSGTSELSISSYSIDFYGNYVDTTLAVYGRRYFFYAYLLTKTAIILKPIKLNYESIFYNDKEIVYYLSLENIEKIKANDKRILYVMKNCKNLYVTLTNCGSFRFKKLLMEYANKKNIDFEIEGEEIISYIKNSNNINYGGDNINTMERERSNLLFISFFLLIFIVLLCLLLLW
ncbi:MAG: hypothetical protein ACRDD2_09735 [Sarcina sp.]